MELAIGATAQISQTITEADVLLFAKVSGDYNPVHINPEAAQNSIFKKQIAHGFLVGSLISNVIGNQLPGPGTIYMEQNMKFLKPVFLNDTVTATVVISNVINKDKHIYKLNTIVTNQHGEIVIEGFAIVKSTQ